VTTEASRQILDQQWTGGAEKRGRRRQILSGVAGVESRPSTNGSNMGKTLQEIRNSCEADLPRIFEVWESSVRATHHFLSEADIQFLIPLVKKELALFSFLYCLRDSGGEVYAFMGVANAKIEMLFVHPTKRGSGAGRTLAQYAIDVLNANLVDVNEQNEQAVGFYQYLGFRLINRSSLDPTGKPFPLLHMEFRPSPERVDS
jgi:putative acetyltransferase